MSEFNVIRGLEHAPLEPLRGKTAAVIGYGNQGHAHALNLRDSGVTVLVANRRQTRNGQRALADGFDPQPIESVVSDADLLIIALPDESQPGVFTECIQPHLRPESTIGFIHGFSIHYGLIQPPHDVGVVMVAPKGPGATLRQRFVQGLGIPCLFAMHQDSPGRDAKQVALAWASGIGCARAGIISTSFAHETETDLFGEQAVLCGGMTSLVLAAFEALVAAGYPPELAYLECCHEVKQIADLVYEHGLSGMMKAISNTAEFGAYTAGPRIIDANVRRKLDAILADIRDGTFAESLRKDYEDGSPWLTEHRRQMAEHPIEQAGAAIRSLMPRSAVPEPGASHTTSADA